MQKYQSQFNTLLGVKTEPNAHELALFARAQHYISKLTWIPGVEMVAVVNSLSMYATHENSDIDLFIVTQPGMIWFVRFFVTLTLWMHGVWRHGADIAGNFCLSFWITTDALDLERIAIDNDIYLYNWIYHLKPIFTRGDAYERFLEANKWVEVDEAMRTQNTQYKIDTNPSKFSIYKILSVLSYLLSALIRFFWLPKTLRRYKKIGSPEGVIIGDTMLKFHDQDRRKQIRDTILEKNFDK